MELQDYLRHALKDEKFQKLYKTYDLAFEVGQMITTARLIRGITQTTLAKLAGTKQPSIARIEDGRSLPSLRFLEKIAQALGTYLLAPTFADPALSLTQKNKTISLTCSLTIPKKHTTVDATVIPQASPSTFIIKEPVLSYTYTY